MNLWINLTNLIYFNKKLFTKNVMFLKSSVFRFVRSITIQYQRLTFSVHWRTDCGAWIKPWIDRDLDRSFSFEILCTICTMNSSGEFRWKIGVLLSILPFPIYTREKERIYIFSYSLLRILRTIETLGLNNRIAFSSIKPQSSLIVGRAILLKFTYNNVAYFIY